MISHSEYIEVALSNSDDNENSIHFIDGNHEFEYIEEPEEEQTISQPLQNDHGDDGNAESYYTIEIDDEFDTDFEKDSLIA